PGGGGRGGGGRGRGGGGGGAGGGGGRNWELPGPPPPGGGPATGDRLVASGPASPVLLVQAGPTATDASPSGWQFSFAPYLWATRIGANLAVGPVQRHLTVDFVDIVPDLHFAAAGHFEATWHA